MTETIKLMYFWLSHFDKNNDFERIPVGREIVSQLFFVCG